MARAALRLPGLPPIRGGAGTLMSAGLIATLMHPVLRGSGADAGGAMLLAIAVGLGMLASVLVHEGAHAITARSFGARVEHIALTLTGGHTQYRAAHLGPGQGALIALAGPLSNAVLGAVLALLQGALMAAPPVLTAVGLLSTLNYGLAVFNALPGLPLDGGRALQGALAKATGRAWLGEALAGWAGRLLAVVLALAAVPSLIRSGIGPGAGPRLMITVIMLLIAAQLWQGASQALRWASARRRAERVPPTARILPVTVVRSGTPLAALPAPTDATHPVLVREGERWLQVDPVLAAGVPEEARARTDIAAVAPVMGPVAVVAVSDAQEAVVAADASGKDVSLVVIDATGRPLGLIPAPRLDP